MHPLSEMLDAVFKPAPRKTREAASVRRAREEAARIAPVAGVTIEKLQHGMNVWPPAGIDDKSDPFFGDHFAADWTDALEMVRAYAALMNR